MRDGSHLARALHNIKRKTIKYVYIMKNQFKEVAQLVAAIRDLVTPNETAVGEALNFTASRDTTKTEEVYTFSRHSEEQSITVKITQTETGGARVEWETVGDLDLDKAKADLISAKTWNL